MRTLYEFIALTHNIGLTKPNLPRVKLEGFEDEAKVEMTPKTKPFDFMLFSLFSCTVNSGSLYLSYVLLCNTCRFLLFWVGLL